VCILILVFSSFLDADGAAGSMNRIDERHATCGIIRTGSAQRTRQPASLFVVET
jgi:hypothetical protein